MYKYSNQKIKWMFGDLEDHLKAKWIYNNSDYIKLANQVDWDNLCTPLEQAYCRNNGRASLNTRRMLALEILKHLLKLSDEKLVHQLQTNLEVQYFCGIQNMYEDTTMESSSLTHFRNRLAKHPGILEAIQKVHLTEAIRKLPKKRQGQYDQDGTVIEEKMKYPNDIELLKDMTQKWAKIINKARDFLQKTWEKAGEVIVARGKKLAKDLYLKYSFTKKKTKELCEQTRKEMKKYSESMMKQVAEIYEKVKYFKDKEIKVFKSRIKEYMNIGKEVLRQQRKMIKEKTKSISWRIVSFAKPHIRPIIKGKAGKRIQFWAKAHIGLVGGKVAVAVGVWWENDHESKHVIDGIKLVESVRGKLPSEVWYDKWWRSQKIYDYLEKEWIANRIQGSAKRKELAKPQRKRLYNRRAFVENVINDVLNHRGVNKSLYAQENAQWNLLMGCMASNLIRVR